MTDRAGHPPPYAVFDGTGQTNQAVKTCDPGRKEAKVVNSPKVLKMGVNSPVTARIYA